MKRIISTSIFALGIVFILSSCGSSKDLQQPEYRDIRNVKVKELGLLQSTATVDLVYYNPNNFTAQLTDATGDIYIDNAFFGKFTLAEKVRVKKHSEFILPALVKIDMV